MRTLIALLLTATAAQADTDWTMVDFDTVEKTVVASSSDKPHTANVHGTPYVGPDYAVTSFETVNWGR